MAKRKRNQIADLPSAMSKVKDPRRRGNRERYHPLVDILVIAVCTMVAGGDSFEDMELFGNEKKGWLGEFLELPYGIPSHDTFERVFEAMDTGEFLGAFMGWTKAACRRIGGGEVVPIDGKALRRALDAGESAQVIVGAWAAGSGICLGQLKVDAKSNEITAVPELLDLLGIEGCTVTIDAMGCQKEIAKKIRAGGGDYVLALKGNHPGLHARVTAYLDVRAALGTGGEGYSEERSKSGHGRKEVRRCWAVGELEVWLEFHGEWEGLLSVAVVEREWVEKGETKVERRYFITSLEPDAAKIAHAVRAHWGIENSVHWVLDVTFREDASRARTRNAPANLSSLRRWALNLLRIGDSSKLTIAARRKKAAWNTDYLLKLLTTNSNA